MKLRGIFDGMASSQGPEYIHDNTFMTVLNTSSIIMAMSVDNTSLQYSSIRIVGIFHPP